MSLGSLPSLVVLPPLNLLLAACVGALRGGRRFGRPLLAIGLGGLWLLSLPVVSGWLLVATETGLGVTAPSGNAPGAIVILSGDQAQMQVGSALVWRVGLLTLEREQEGARLARETHLPVLVTGGRVHPWSPPLGMLMADSMAEDFGVKVKWVESHSQDTWENARDSAAILRLADITRVYVVTQAWHMARALLAFRRAGLDPVAAPVPRDAPPPLRPYVFLPSVRAWTDSYYALHELVGLVWYEIRP